MNGTLERFAGDGMMIFFNDPIQLENPVMNAFRMALAMQAGFAPLRAAWKKRGYDLDLGMGFVQGYATLGAIGMKAVGTMRASAALQPCGASMQRSEGGQILTKSEDAGTH
jgi:class 3 adenylate cyclase